MTGAANTRVRFLDLLRLARERNASDLHLAHGEPPVLRIDGDLVRLDLQPIAEEQLNDVGSFLLGTKRWLHLSHRRDLDSTFRDEGLGAFRIHAYRTLGHPRFAIRLIANEMPCLESLCFPPILEELATKHAGLVLFVGPTGSGKTTALAAMVDRINRTASRHIVTVEDPVEYVHQPIRASVSHRELGEDVDDFAGAVHSFLRADPDVILIGELRDPNTMQAALTAAETGHLVLSTLHTGDASQTIDRIVDAFAGAQQSQVRSQLAQTLLGVISIRLVQSATGNGRRAAVEVLVATDGVRALIRDGKTHQLRNAIVTGRHAGMQTLETHLSDLVSRRDVTVEVARASTDRPSEIRLPENVPW